MDIARSVQEVTEEIVFRMLHVHNVTGLENICLAGGVGSTAWPTGGSCGRAFKNVWIQPAAGDAGGAVGAALCVAPVPGNAGLQAEPGTPSRAPISARSSIARASRGTWIGIAYPTA